MDFYKGLAIYILPEGVTDYFDLVDFCEEPAHEKDQLCKKELHLYLEEKDNRPVGFEGIKSNGFTEERKILDFPVRSRRTILHVRRLKRETVKDVNCQKAEFRKYLEGLAKKRRQYREWCRKQGKKRPKGKRRGPKPKRLSMRFEPAKLSNGETLVEALTRCRTQLAKSRDKWTEKEKQRAKILFEIYPKLKEAYDLVNDLRIIFRNKKLTKETAKEKLTEWYGKVTKSTLREIKSVKDSIRHYEDEILNYFDKRETNASAESLNSKMKCFRSSLRGVRDIPYFFYRSVMVFG